MGTGTGLHHRGAFPPAQRLEYRQKKTPQRQNGGPAPREQAPPIVQQVLRSPGRPLDAQARSFFEPRFGHDFSKVRVHSDERAAASAHAINARAYTAGQDLVFAGGQYAPSTRDGEQLLAHELAHVVQQENAAGPSGNSDLALGAADHGSELEAASAARIASSGWNSASSGLDIASRESRPVVQRATNDEEWAKEYGKHKSFLQKPYEEFKAGLGEVRPTTQGGLSQNLGRPIKRLPTKGTPAAPEITMPVLKEIYPGLAKDAAADPAKASKAQAYLDSLNQAFRIMKIDTVEAQANYLAHAFIESDQFRQFTETQGSVNQGAQKWMDDPTAVKLDTTDLAARYPQGQGIQEVNPGGKFEFIGRGPVQVTGKGEYVEAIAMLEKTAEQYEKEAAAGDTRAKASAQLAREAVTAVKADQRQAANPKYAFLISAAHMKTLGADVKVAHQAPGTPWTGADAASSWVAGGLQAAGSPQAKALIDKSAAYAHILDVLSREAKKTPQSGTVAEK
ncbi:MAG TPA: DUF4157 domain-containing protein [Candidatus Angelobacter sp.]